MKVGSLVVRSYVWPELVAGIVVEEQVNQVVLPDSGTQGSFSYTEDSYVIAWADGAVSTESGNEIECFEGMLHKLKNGWEKNESR